MDKSIFFKRELDWIENEDIKELFKACRDNAPDYLYCIPSSSSGKYHASYELSLGGLYRHSLAVARFTHHFLSIEQYSKEFTDREKDLMIIAACFHDSIKNGLNGSQYTINTHPIEGAKFVREQNGTLDNPISDEEIDFVCGCIESHMGEWNTDKKGVEILKKPTTLSQQLIHLADYLGSRKDIELLFGFDEEYKDEITEPVFTKEERDNYKITFGKYKGVAFGDVVREDPDYIEWMYNSHFDEEAKFKVPEPLWTFAKEIIEWDGEDEDDIDDWEI